MTEEETASYKGTVISDRPGKMLVAFSQDWEVSKIEGALMLQELVTSVLPLLGSP